MAYYVAVSDHGDAEFFFDLLYAGPVNFACEFLVRGSAMNTQRRNARAG